MEQGVKNFIILKELAGNPPPRLNAVQKLLAPHIDLLTELWASAWVMTVIVLCVILWAEYRNQKNPGKN